MEINGEATSIWVAYSKRGIQEIEKERNTWKEWMKSTIIKETMAKNLEFFAFFVYCKVYMLLRKSILIFGRNG